jgi:diguanylate cyclase (GGDEF)-like protein/PAS domain S-box-containing protein
VADDEPAIREMLSNILVERVGCQVSLVATGDEAVSLLETEHFDVVIADMVMPGLHGIELVKTLNDRFPDVDVLVMTGFGDAFPFVEVVRAGASDFILKPHQPGEIEAKLLRIFKDRELREQLFFAEQKYRNLFEHSMEGNILISPETFEVLDANFAFATLVGIEHDDIIGIPIFDLLDPAAHARFREGVEMFRPAGQGKLVDVTLPRPEGDELYIDISMAFVSIPGDEIVFLTFRDVTEKRREQHRLMHAAQTDALTGLSNKKMLHTRLRTVVPDGRRRRGDDHSCLMFIDLDNFKQCNDTHGHQAGDRLIKTVGEIIRGTISEQGDEGFRYGGDEFAVLLPGADTVGAVEVAERMRSQFESGQCFGTTMSIGVAEYKEGMDTEAFIGAADGALYKAKDGGKNIVHVA